MLKTQLAQQLLNTQGFQIVTPRVWAERQNMLTNAAMSTVETRKEMALIDANLKRYAKASHILTDALGVTRTWHNTWEEFRILKKLAKVGGGSVM